jgi:hypothetical protein
VAGFLRRFAARLSVAFAPKRALDRLFSPARHFRHPDEVLKDNTLDHVWQVYDLAPEFPEPRRTVGMGRRGVIAIHRRPSIIRTSRSCRESAFPQR